MPWVISSPKPAMSIRYYGHRVQEFNPSDLKLVSTHRLFVNGPFLNCEDCANEKLEIIDKETFLLKSSRFLRTKMFGYGQIERHQFWTIPAGFTSDFRFQKSF
jgi:hypothetical protein